MSSRSGRSPGFYLAARSVHPFPRRLPSHGRTGRRDTQPSPLSTQFNHRAVWISLTLGGRAAIFSLAVLWLGGRIITSGAMAPTLLKGDRVLVSGLPYLIGAPKRGDVVLYRAPPSASIDEREFIKRVVGLPGDTVAVTSTRAVVDGRVAATFSYNEATGIHYRPHAVTLADAIFAEMRTHPPVLADGQVVLRRGLAEPLRIMAAPAVDVRIRAGGVYNGRRRLMNLPRGTDVHQVRNLTRIGGDPRVQGSVIVVEGDPQLVLVRGRELTLVPGHLLLNGKPLDEPYVAEAPHYTMAPFKVPPGYYWVLGDNRNDSNDSSQWGPLESGRILGRAEWIYWPPSRIGTIRRR